MTPISNEKDSLLGNRYVKNGGDVEESDDDDDQDREFKPIKDKTWSFSHSRCQVATAGTSSMPSPGRSVVGSRQHSVEDSALHTATKKQSDGSKGGQHYVFCLIYAIVNVIIAVPGLFGYAAVIFNHPIYSNHMNALSKRKYCMMYTTFVRCVPVTSDLVSPAIQ